MDLNILKENSKLGGSVKLNYGNFFVAAPYDHLLDAYGLLQGEKNRPFLMQKITKSINETLKKVDGNMATEKQFRNLCADIVLWTANQIIDGKLSFQDIERIEV